MHGVFFRVFFFACLRGMGFRNISKEGSRIGFDVGSIETATIQYAKVSDCTGQDRRSEADALVGCLFDSSTAGI